MKNIHITSAIISACCIFCSSLHSEIILPSVITNGVILQRDCHIPVWGRGVPGEQVNVSINGQNAFTSVHSDSTWNVMLQPMKAGGPYTLKVNDKEVEDVLIGDLYLCSGQSNMELTVSRTLDYFKDEINSYSNTEIREFKVPKNYAFHGSRNDVAPSEWKKAEPETSERFGALVYFMAKELYDKNGHVPVGIINASWGGSKIESWISESGLKEYPDRIHRLRIAENDEYRETLEKGERMARQLWYQTMDSNDPGIIGEKKWNSPDFDDTEWDKVSLMDDEWGKCGEKTINGSHWLRKTFKVSPDRDGQEAELRLGCIVDADSVWINLHFVGTTSYQYPPRIYKIPEGILKSGDNVICIRVVSNAGVPHLVKDKPHKIIYHDGNEISLEGEWRHNIGCQMPQTPFVTDFFQTPSVLFNGLISPFRKIPFRGVVWYQGESDIDIRFEYKDLMKSLITDWRNAFANERLPFYVVELADFLHESDFNRRKSWQEMRESQRKAAEETSNAWWIENGDIGEWNDIHPRDKKTPGVRVAYKILNQRK